MASSFIPVAAALAVLAPVALQATPAQTAPAPVTFAHTAPAALLGAERDNVVAAAATALSKVSTAKGTFTQIDPNGYISTGNFALQRPGRVLFDYDDPVPITIRADGATVAA